MESFLVSTVPLIDKEYNKKICDIMDWNFETVHFRIPEENWYIYPTWLFRYIQAIIVPVITLSAISTKILMKKEIKQYLCGNSIHPVHN